MEKPHTLLVILWADCIPWYNNMPSVYRKRQNMSIAPRLNRLFAPDGNCFDVAVDHGFFGERTFLNSIENMQQVVETLVDANPDAIQLSIGQAPILQN